MADGHRPPLRHPRRGDLRARRRAAARAGRGRQRGRRPSRGRPTRCSPRSTRSARLAAEPWPTASPCGCGWRSTPARRASATTATTPGRRSSAPPGCAAIAPRRPGLVSRRPPRDLVIDHLGDDVAFVDLGVHRLKDLARPEHVWQLAHADLRAEFPPLRSLDAVPNNLPVPLSSFIGRFDEIDTVVGSSLDNRLVTLTGVGRRGQDPPRAAGRRRGRRALPRRRLVGRARRPSTNPALVPSAISRATMLPEDPRRPRRSGSCDAVEPKRTLLVLDNCEHLLDGCADVAAALLASCSDVVGARDEPGAAQRARRAELAGPAARDSHRGATHEPVAALSQYDACGCSSTAPAKAARTSASPTTTAPTVRRDLRPARRHPAGHRARRRALPRPHAGADPRRPRRRDRAARRRAAGGAAAPPDDRSLDRVEPLAARPTPSSCCSAVSAVFAARSPSTPPRPSSPTTSTPGGAGARPPRTPRGPVARPDGRPPSPRRASACSRRCASSRDASSSVLARSTRSRPVTPRTSPSADARCGRCSTKA